MADINFEIGDKKAFEEYLTDKFNRARNNAADLSEKMEDMKFADKIKIFTQLRNEHIETAEKAALMYHQLQNGKI